MEETKKDKAELTEKQLEHAAGGGTVDNREQMFNCCKCVACGQLYAYDLGEKYNYKCRNCESVLVPHYSASAVIRC